MRSEWRHHHKFCCIRFSFFALSLTSTDTHLVLFPIPCFLDSLRLAIRRITHFLLSRSLDTMGRKESYTNVSHFCSFLDLNQKQGMAFGQASVLGMPWRWLRGLVPVIGPRAVGVARMMTLVMSATVAFAFSMSLATWADALWRLRVMLLEGNKRRL